MSFGIFLFQLLLREGNLGLLGDTEKSSSLIISKSLIL